MSKSVGVYLNDEYVTWAHSDSAKFWGDALKNCGISCEASFVITGAYTSEVRVHSTNRSAERSLESVIRVIASIKPAPETLTETAHAFERAINAEPGIEVELQQLDISTHADPNRSRWHLVVTRNERKQVYP